MSALTTIAGIFGRLLMVRVYKERCERLEAENKRLRAERDRARRRSAPRHGAARELRREALRLRVAP